MGKAARIRRSRQQDKTGKITEDQPGQHDDPGFVPARSAAAREVMQRLEQTQMPCRAVFLDELFPAGSTLAPMKNLAGEGDPVLDLSGKSDRVPVLMFEPEFMVVVKDIATGMTHDQRIESLIAGGFTRVPPMAMIGGLIADDWQVHRTADGVALHDPYGGEVASGTLELEPEWVSAAASAGQIMVLVGTHLGIRIPASRPTGSYTAAEQMKEFHRCRRAGGIIAATIAWCGPQGDKALKWTLMRQGSLGLALPLAYIPAMSFRAHGGAEAFGFTAIPPPGMAASGPAVAHGLIAELTATDLDLLQPGEVRELGWVCGYYSPDDDEFFASWRREAFRRGCILAAAGSKELPVTGPDIAKRALKVLLDSVAAIVPLTPASIRAGAILK